MKYIITLLTISYSFLGFSQSIFDKYEENKDVGSVIVSQKMFEMFSKIATEDEESKDFMRIAKNLSGLKVFTTTDANTSSNISKDVNSYLKTARLEELLRTKDKSGKVRFYAKQGKNSEHLSELLMFVNGNDNNETVLLLLTGDINLKDLKALSKKMNLPKEIGELE